MPSPDTPRLLFVHAHPDDESLTTGATIASYTARGAQVAVLTCTLGEEGEVIGDRWARLAVDDADQLGGYRVGELTAALRALGVGEPRFLGGAGRWRDSGMAGTPARRSPRFADAGDEAVRALAAVVTALRPHVVVTYDPRGGYGHPDHIRAHLTTTAAVAAAGRDGGWSVPKVYWTVTSDVALAAGAAGLVDLRLPAHWRLPRPEDLAFGFPDAAITAEIDGSAVIAAKVTALRAHRTQVAVSPDGRAFALSNGIALPLQATEHYVLVSGSRGPLDGRGRETDLLAGLGPW